MADHHAGEDTPWSGLLFGNIYFARTGMPWPIIVKVWWMDPVVVDAILILAIDPGQKPAQ